MMCFGVAFNQNIGNLFSGMGNTVSLLSTTFRLSTLHWTLPMRAYRFAFALLCLLPGTIGYAGVSGGSDREIANAIAKKIIDGYGKFDDRRAVEESRKGKIYYVNPRSKGNPLFVFYEISSKEDILQIEHLARKALAEVPGVQSISLRFYEAQNMPNNIRLREKLLHSADLKRSSK